LFRGKERGILEREAQLFNDIIDTDEMKNLFALFQQATGLTTGLVDHNNGTLLVGSGWSDICTTFHRKSADHAASCDKNIQKLAAKSNRPNQFAFATCENGLIKGATPVMVGNTHVANLISGHVFLEKPDIRRFRDQAEKHGYDMEAYMATLDEVPVVDESKLKAALKFMTGFTATIASLASFRLQEISESSEDKALLPICASCKSIRDKNGCWQQIETFLQHQTKSELTHSICPDCADTLYPEYSLNKKKRTQ